MPSKKTDPTDAAASGHTTRRTGVARTPTQPISEIRAFNRFYTNLIGALDYSRQLYVPYTLTEARVLYELLHSSRTDAADLRGELSLDAGYLSRLLTKFEKDQLIERAPARRDPRRQHITLTRRGRTAAELLEERSQESVGALLARIPTSNRPRLTAAMRTIQDVLSQSRPPRPEDILLRAPTPGDLGWMIHRNAAVYAAEYGWNSAYEGLVARIIADFSEHHDPRLERVWIAELDDRPVGSVMCVRDTQDGAEHIFDGGTQEDHGTDHDRDDVTDRGKNQGIYRAVDDHEDTAPADSAAEAATPLGPRPTDPGTARLRLLLVEPEARGLGIGDLLVRTCIDFAREVGYEDMVLWTNDILHAARHIYQRHGFALTAEAPHHSFGADLIGQDWHLSLRPGGESEAA